MSMADHHRAGYRRAHEASRLVARIVEPACVHDAASVVPDKRIAHLPLMLASYGFVIKGVAQQAQQSIALGGVYPDDVSCQQWIDVDSWLTRDRMSIDDRVHCMCSSLRLRVEGGCGRSCRGVALVATVHKSRAQTIQTFFEPRVESRIRECRIGEARVAAA